MRLYAAEILPVLKGRSAPVNAAAGRSPYQQNGQMQA